MGLPDRPSVHQLDAIFRSVATQSPAIASLAPVFQLAPVLRRQRRSAPYFLTQPGFANLAYAAFDYSSHGLRPSTPFPPCSGLYCLGEETLFWPRPHFSGREPRSGPFQLQAPKICPKASWGPSAGLYALRAPRSLIT